MHAAPPVSHPVEPGRSLAGALALAWALGVAALGGWLLQADVPRAWQAATFLLAATCGLATYRSWRTLPRGTLAWDGAAWWWTPVAGSAQEGRVERALDLQSRLLMRWHPTCGPTRWLWVERRSAPLHWDALRRAVHAAPASDFRAAARPPIAEP